MDKLDDSLTSITTVLARNTLRVITGKDYGMNFNSGKNSKRFRNHRTNNIRPNFEPDEELDTVLGRLAKLFKLYIYHDVSDLERIKQNVNRLKSIRSTISSDEYIRRVAVISEEMEILERQKKSLRNINPENPSERAPREKVKRKITLKKLTDKARRERPKSDISSESQSGSAPRDKSRWLENKSEKAIQKKEKWKNTRKRYYENSPSEKTNPENEEVDSFFDRLARLYNQYIYEDVPDLQRIKQNVNRLKTIRSTIPPEEYARKLTEISEEMEILESRGNRKLSHFERLTSSESQSGNSPPEKTNWKTYSENDEVDTFFGRLAKLYKLNIYENVPKLERIEENVNQLKTIRSTISPEEYTRKLTEISEELYILESPKNPKPKILEKSKRITTSESESGTSPREETLCVEESEEESVSLENENVTEEQSENARFTKYSTRKTTLKSMSEKMSDLERSIFQTNRSDQQFKFDHLTKQVESLKDDLEEGIVSPDEYDTRISFIQQKYSKLHKNIRKLFFYIILEFAENFKLFVRVDFF